LTPPPAIALLKGEAEHATGHDGPPRPLDNILELGPGQVHQHRVGKDPLIKAAKRITAHIKQPRIMPCSAKKLNERRRGIGPGNTHAPAL
jgi:hypothetical protein